MLMPGITSAITPQKSTSGLLKNSAVFKPAATVGLKLLLIGEIIGYSYIKISLQSTDNSKRYKNTAIAFEGTCYEAKTSKNYKIIGTFNTETRVWKLNCFDNSKHLSIFIGRENREGVIEGHWTCKKSILPFYLKKPN